MIIYNPPVDVTLTDGQVAVGNVDDEISSSSDLTFDGVTLYIGGVPFGRGTEDADSGNIAIGEGALASKEAAGTGNICIGFNAGGGITVGEASVIIGYNAGTVGLFDATTLIGKGAGQFATVGTVALGQEAGNRNSNAGNTYIGDFAGFDNTNAGESTYIGYNAGNGTSGGYGNTVIGSTAGQSFTGNYNTVIGRYAARFTNGSNLTIIGANVDPQINISDAILIGSGDGHIRLGSLADGDFYIWKSFGTVGTDGTFFKASVDADGIVTFESSESELIILFKDLPTSAAGLPTDAIWKNGTSIDIV